MHPKEEKRDALGLDEISIGHVNAACLYILLKDLYDYYKKNYNITISLINLRFLLYAPTERRMQWGCEAKFLRTPSYLSEAIYKNKEERGKRLVYYFNGTTAIGLIQIMSSNLISTAFIGT